jgi:hypothetical protein
MVSKGVPNRKSPKKDNLKRSQYIQSNAKNLNIELYISKRYVRILVNNSHIKCGQLKSAKSENYYAVMPDSQ